MTHTALDSTRQDAARLQAAAHALDQARMLRQPLDQGQIELRGVEEAYAVQAAGMALREARGERQYGIKMGFTSRAKMQQMGVSEMIAGRLGEAGRAEDGGELSRAAFIHPRIEPEIAFLLSRDLGEDTDATPGPDELARAVDAVAPALEIIDSRYRDFRFDLPAVVADNTSAAAFVVGAWQPVRPMLDTLGLLMHLPQPQRTVCGCTAAILGDPWRALAAAVRLANRHGLPLRAGAIVMAGAATAAEPLPERGLVTLEMSGLGRVQLHVVP